MIKICVKKARKFDLVFTQKSVLDQFFIRITSSVCKLTVETDAS